jgi:hypothetical protein
MEPSSRRHARLRPKSPCVPTVGASPPSAKPPGTSPGEIRRTAAKKSVFATWPAPRLARQSAERLAVADQPAFGRRRHTVVLCCRPSTSKSTVAWNIRVNSATQDSAGAWRLEVPVRTGFHRPRDRFPPRPPQGSSLCSHQPPSATNPSRKQCAMSPKKPSPASVVTGSMPPNRVSNEPVALKHPQPPISAEGRAAGSSTTL